MNPPICFQYILNHFISSLGGEFFMSDIFADRRVPASLQKDPVLWGECLSGALYWEDFRRILLKAGFRDVRIVEEHSVVPEGKIGALLSGIKFVSRTISAFISDSIE